MRGDGDDEGLGRDDGGDWKGCVYVVGVVVDARDARGDDGEEEGRRARRGRGKEG